METVQPERGERPLGNDYRRAAALAEVKRPECHILQDRRAKQLIVRVLKQQPGAGADLAEIPFLPTLGAEGDDAAGGGLAEADHQVKQRCLAGTVGADDRHTVSRMQIEVDAVEYSAASGIGEGDATQREQRRRHPAILPATPEAPSTSNAMATTPANIQSAKLGGFASTTK